MQPNRDRLGLRVPTERIARRAMLWWGLRSLLQMGLVRLALEFLDRQFPQYYQYWEPLVVLTYVVGFVMVVVVPPVRYQIQRWEVADASVFVRDGLFAVALRIAPYARVQTVATRRDPIALLLGLSTVEVSTASSMGPLRLVGLDKDLAADLETRIADAAEAARGEAA